MLQETETIVAADGVTDPSPAETPDRSTRLLALFIAVLIVAGLYLRSDLLFHFPVNQDECCYLNGVHVYQRGEPIVPFQSLHVHFFSWLATVSHNEVTQIMRGREVMSLLFLGACTFLFLLGRHLMGLVPSLFILLCYLSFQFTIVHAAEFRSDTPAMFLSMLALYLFMAKKGSWLAQAAAGLAMAVACLFTIKAGLYLGLLTLLLLIRLRASSNRGGDLRNTGWFAAFFVLAAVGVYMLHAATLADFEPVRQAGFLPRAFSTFLLPRRIIWGREFLLLTLRSDSIVWLLVALGVVACVVDLLGRKCHFRERTACLLGMSFPLLSILFYRNTFPYYYAFMMPPVALLCGYAFSRLLLTIRPLDRRLASVVVVILSLGVFAQNYGLRYYLLFKEWPVTANQHGLLADIHKIFPKPVGYLDCPQMVASFPHAGFWMGSKSIELYLQAGVPVLKEMLSEKKPVFLLANAGYLNLDSARPPVVQGGLTLLDEDWRALKSHFIHHYGPIWVAGKQFDFGAEHTFHSFDIAAAGRYTLEAGADVSIDGAACHNGDVIELEEGRHTIEAKPAAGGVKLRWGDHLHCPAEPYSGLPVFLSN